MMRVSITKPSPSYKYIMAILPLLILFSGSSCYRKKIIKHEEWKVLDVLYNINNKTLLIKGRNIGDNKIKYLVIPDVSEMNDNSIKENVINSKYEWASQGNMYYSSTEQEYYNSEKSNGFHRKDHLEASIVRSYPGNNHEIKYVAEGIGGNRKYQSSKIVSIMKPEELQGYTSLNVKEWKKLIYEERYEYIPRVGGP